MSEPMYCPRRAEGPSFTKGPDEWRVRDGHRHCSYCGSLHPEELFAAIEVGATVTPTDKSYKIYVDVPDARAGELKVTGMRNHAPAEGETGWELVTEENLPDLLADGWSERNLGSWMMKTPRGETIHDKFYFQHLSDEERTRFIDLVNAKTMKLAHPGYFYVLPFFAKPAHADVA